MRATSGQQAGTGSMWGNAVSTCWQRWEHLQAQCRSRDDYAMIVLPTEAYEVLQRVMDPGEEIESCYVPPTKAYGPRGALPPFTNLPLWIYPTTCRPDGSRRTYLLFEQDGKWVVCMNRPLGVPRPA